MVDGLETILSSDFRTAETRKHNYNYKLLAEGSSGGGGDMVPQMNGGGNVELSVTGSAVIPIPAQEVKQATFANGSEDDFMVVHNGVEFPVFARGYFTFFGLTNLSELSVKGNGREHKVHIRWEN